MGIIADNKKNLGAEIIVNPTGGTNSMTIGAYRAAVLADVPAQVSTGVRDEKHQITAFTHEWQTINRRDIASAENDAFANECLKRFDYESVYNRYQPNQNTGSSDQEKIVEIRLTAQAFMAWNSFNFDEAFKIMSHFERRRKKKYFSNHLRGLGGLKKIQCTPRDQVPIHLLISEFWNSAERSAARSHYSESILKFYRMLEAACQSVLLHSYGIFAGDVPKQAMDKLGIKPLPTEGGHSESFKLSMKNMIRVFKKNDTSKKLRLRDFLIENEIQLKKYISLRNYSIFAHGYEVIDETQWKMIKEFVEQQFLPSLQEDGGPLNGGFILVPQLPSSLEGFGLSETGED
jgi:CRISPR-associated protein (TIGR02710 family)